MSVDNDVHDYDGVYGVDNYDIDDGGVVVNDINESYINIFFYTI